jgi:hypothetical protein
MMFGKLREFKEKRSQKKIAKYAKLIKNGKAIKDERRAALEYMKALDDMEVAVPSLLARYNYSLEHGINDTREKEVAMDGIVKYGEKAVPYLEEHLKNTTRIAWPIKILNKIAPEDLVVKTLREVLDPAANSFDQAAVDKNYDVLCYLRDYKLEGFLDTLKGFLANPDERVRFAAAEALIEQEYPEVPALLEGFLVDDTSENRRIRQAVVDAFLEKGWKVSNPAKFENGLVVEGVFVKKDGVLENRGAHGEYH